MKYLKFYESHPYKWENITEKNGKLYINIYQLASEMEDSLKYKDDQILTKIEKEKLIAKEKEYRNLIRKMLLDNVITFDSSYEDNITGICEDVEFHSGFGDARANGFQFEYIHIKIENLTNDEELDNALDIGDDVVIVHLDIDSDVFRDSKKYNL